MGIMILIVTYYIATKDVLDLQVTTLLKMTTSRFFKWLCMFLQIKCIFYIKGQNLLYRIMINSKLGRPAVVCGASFFQLEYSTSGRGYLINSVLKKNLQYGFLFKNIDNNRFYPVTQSWLEMMSTSEGFEFIFLCHPCFWYDTV